MPVAQEIHSKLEEIFSPDTLLVEDESEKHRGHAGYGENGESHFKVTIGAAVFVPMSRIERHRAVHKALGAELVGRIHALALTIEG